jgi:hypothetical protein
MTPKKVADSPSAWFAVLERSVRTNDRRLFDEAERNLRELGVKVTITWPAFERRQEATPT